MFARVRIRLTAIYVIAMLAFIMLIGSISFSLIRYYFQATTDLALLHKMAHEYELLSLPEPPELSAADAQWAILRKRWMSLNVAQITGDSRKTATPKAPESTAGTVADIALEETYDGELAAIYMFPLDAEGRLTVASGKLIIQPNLPSLYQARDFGNDLRTIYTESGVRTRVLTYRMPKGAGAAYIQLGRIQGDQDLILNQLLTGMLVSGSLIALFSSVGCWWLAWRSLEPARQAWHRQQMFIANASHELKTPLALIQLSSEVAASPKTTDAERLELAHDVIRETQYMSELISNLLLLSRLDAEGARTALRDISVYNILSDVQTRVRPLISKHGLTLSMNCGQSLHARADDIRLRQILMIVLENAMKHTPAGGSIHLSAKQTGTHIAISAQDTGPGIAPEHLPHIFEPFYQGDPAHSSTSNAGLGLSIAKSLAGAMHGTIAIQSAPGQGATAILTLPAAPQPG